MPAVPPGTIARTPVPHMPRRTITRIPATIVISIPAMAVMAAVPMMTMAVVAIVMTGIPRSGVRVRWVAVVAAAVMMVVANVAQGVAQHDSGDHATDDGPGVAVVT